ncbi:MAG: hypothetical protein KCHDKBKB_01319 [Elusimicrobia bacterium]|nr:hypothetical protein [Elusimicrobiota bacterium]
MKTHRLKAFAIIVTLISFQQLVVLADDLTGGLRLEYWTYGVTGNVTVEGSSADLDDTSKVINGNNHGFTIGGERRFDNWGLMMDLFFGKQNTSQQLSSSQSVQWDFESAIFTGGAYLSFLDTDFDGSDRNLQLDGLAGIRGYSNSYKLQFEPYDPNNDRDRSDYVNWVDPYLGMRIKSALSEKWAVELYGDAGGFAIGSASELSVLAHAAIVWSVTPGLNILGGYRLFDLESAEPSGDRPTQLDIQMRGFTLGIEGKF